MIRGYEKDDPPPRRQKAVTPALLLDLVKYTKGLSEWAKHAADLIVGGYFFAMRACEFCRTEKPGRTRRVTLGDIVFRDQHSRVVAQGDPKLDEKAMFVTICFTDQKNGTKMERRSHRKTGQETLCPVKSWARVVQRVRSQIRTREDDSIPVCVYREGQSAKEIRSSQVLQLIRESCEFHDGENRYGIKASELGTRSIRSGAAMALAIQGDTSDKKIMMLGRWKSTAFLNYIRPQVLVTPHNRWRRRNHFWTLGTIKGMPERPSHHAFQTCCMVKRSLHSPFPSHFKMVLVWKGGGRIGSKPIRPF